MLIRRKQPLLMVTASDTKCNAHSTLCSRQEIASLIYCGIHQWSAEKWRMPDCKSALLIRLGCIINGCNCLMNLMLCVV